jgi:hypothetical protein
MIYVRLDVGLGDFFTPGGRSFLGGIFFGGNKGIVRRDLDMFPWTGGEDG